MLAAEVRMSPVVPVAGNGKARFQLIAVEDVAACLVAALEREDVVGRTLEVGGPEYLTYDEIIDLIGDTLGKRTFKAHVPLPLMAVIVRFMELFPRPAVTSEQLKMLKLDNVTDLDSVENHFGFVPASPRGNIGYVSRIGLFDALKMNMGVMPAHIRDH